jgi:exopolysaccharide biosynthesis polyprenyl glycosylphosphotransferase
MGSITNYPDEFDLYPCIQAAFPRGAKLDAAEQGVKRIPFAPWAIAARIWSEHANSIEVAADFLLTNAAVVFAYFSYHWLHLGRSAQFDFSHVEVAASLIGLFYVMMLKANGAYTRATSLLRVRETERVIAASTQLCLLAFAVTFWAELALPRLVVFFATISIPLFVLGEKHLLYLRSRALAAGERLGRRTVIYGAGLSGVRVFSLLARSPKLGLDPVAIVDDDTSKVGTRVHECGYTSTNNLEVLRGPISEEMLRALSADVVIVSTDSITAEAFQRINIECAKAGSILSFVPHDSVVSSRSLSYWNADGMIFASVDKRENVVGAYTLAKRAFDFASALLLLALFSPILLLISAAIRLTSEGPALFVQDRVGKNGKIFKIFKFRTMYVTAPKQAFSPISQCDRRITKVGTFLRRTSLDEIPQLLNVVKGEMSLVGPRPEMPFIVEKYNDLHRQRLQVLPGITGIWQISAGRAQLIHENIQYDLYYIRNRSFFLDIAILLHTVLFAMRGI